MNKILTEDELNKIQEEVHLISQKLDWLDPDIPGEDYQIDSYITRLEELEKIILTSLKNHHKNGIGLKLVK
jgi:hypothetical protein